MLFLIENHIITLNDSLSLSDALDPMLVAVSITDSGTLSDSIQPRNMITVTDSATLSDALRRSRIYREPH